MQALYFDGKSSAGKEVIVEPAKNAYGQPLVRARGAGIDLAWPLEEVRISERVGNSRRFLYFPDGSQCETGDNDGVDAMFAAKVPASARLLQRWEGGMRYALAALAVTLVIAVATVIWGIPALAKQVAFALPEATETLIGRDALAALDQFLFKPSKLPPERQDALKKLLTGMVAGQPDAARFRLELRQGGRAGPNAFALPAGLIVVTDELVALAREDRELEAVLAHEIGHQRQRHILRQLLQDSATALLIAVFMGDVTSVTSLAAAAPTLLLRAKFSRDFEREADDYALDYLAKRAISPDAFTAILQRMEEKQTGRKAGDKDASDYLSSHPATRDRVLRAQKK